MGAADSVALPLEVQPNQTVDISVNLVSPNIPGQYEGLWELRTSEGRMFGLGASAKGLIWVKISTEGPAFSGSTPTTVFSQASPTFASGPAIQVPNSLTAVYDFAGNACSAKWQNKDGSLPCPGLDGDPKGFVIQANQANLEDGTIAWLPTLLTFPQYSAEGYIKGIYPEFQVQAGDHFQTSVSCELGATACSVLFHITYLDSDNTSHDLWVDGEFNDGKYYNLDLDLSNLAGQKVKFVLSVSNLGSSNDDRALWVAPRIVSLPKSNPTLVPTATATVVVARTTVTETPSSTPTSVTTFVPTVASNTPVATSTTGSKTLPPALQVFENIISFFRQILGIK